jgi:hypothetical protein
MNHAITIRIDHATREPENIQGFRFFWAFYVTGFNQALHCQPCFKGAVSRQLSTRTARSGQLYTMNERKSFPYLYICGVGTGPDKLLYQKNFHLPVRYLEGGRAVGETYNGYTITVEDAEALRIPKLELGWKGLPEKTTNCKNFQFCVEYFGWREADPSSGSALLTNSDNP